MTIELTAKALALFNVLKQNEGAKVTAKDVAEAMNAQGGHPDFGAEVTARQISGAATSLANKKLLVRVEDVVEVDGKKVTVKYLELTDEGRAAEAVLKVDAPKKPRGKKAKADVEEEVVED